MEHYGGSKNHHFIPKGILKNFCFEGSSLLRFDFEDADRGIHQRNTDKSFQSFHSNSFMTQSGRRNDGAERWLDQNIDNKIACLVDKLRSELQLYGKIKLVPEDRDLLAKYLCSSLIRKPSFRAEIDRIYDLDSIVDYSFEKLGLSRHAYEQINGEPSDPVSYSDALRANLAAVEVDEVIDQLKKFSLIISSPTSGFDQFVLGDALPIRFGIPIAGKNRSGSEIWTILAPDLAVCFVELGNSVPDKHYFAGFGTSEVRKLNRRIIEESKVVACKCPIYLFGLIKETGKF